MTLRSKVSTPIVALTALISLANDAAAQTLPPMANPLAPIGGTATQLSNNVLGIAAAVGGLIFVIAGILVKLGLVPANFLKFVLVLSIIIAIGPVIVNTIYTAMGTLG